MLAGLFNLLLLTSDITEDWAKFLKIECQPFAPIQDIYKDRIKEANNVQTKVIIADYLAKNKRMPLGRKVVTVQFKDDDTIVFFISGPTFCSTSTISKQETRFINKLKD